MDKKNIQQATLKDVANLAKVSIPTASLVLSGKGHVAKKTREQVEAAARTLGYERTILQKKAIQEQLLSIGLLFNISHAEDYNLKNFRQFLKETEKKVSAKKGSFLIIPHSEKVSDDKTINTIIKARIKGILSFAYFNKQLFTKIEQANIPVVVFNNQQSHNIFISVVLDDFQATYEATRYLINLGHRNILYAYTNRPNIPYLKHNRFFGHQKALEEANIPFNDNMLLFYSTETIDETASALLSLLCKKPKPTAVVCLDDDIASGLEFILRKHGMGVPKDLSLIAHGDLLDYSLIQTPRITTMRLDPSTAAQVTIDLLFACLVNGERSIKTIKIQEHLIERSSCRSI